MILIVGATGTLGGMVARDLIAAGHSIRILVRPGSGYGPLVKAGAEAVLGDLKDPPSLLQACAGVTTVITTANSAARGGADNTDTVDRHGNRALIGAAAEAGVEHFIFVSALGAAEDSPIDFFRAKGEAEAQLKRSGMTYTVLQPNIFMEVWAGMLIGVPVQQGMPVTLVKPAANRHTMVSIGDVAAFTTAAVAAPEARNATLVIGGPDALSWNEVVDQAGVVLGRKLEVRYVEPGEPLPGLPPMIAEMAAGFETYESVFDTTPAAATFQVRLTPVSEFLERLLQPASASSLLNTTSSHGSS